MVHIYFLGYLMVLHEMPGQNKWTCQNNHFRE